MTPTGRDAGGLLLVESAGFDPEVVKFHQPRPQGYLEGGFILTYESGGMSETGSA